jgi:hypothetical protein
MLTIRTWGRSFKEAIRKGQEGLDEAVGLYLWARDHLKEMHLVYPGYQQEDTASEIARVWGIGVEGYCRTAIKLGGGSDPESMARGRAIITKYSHWETIRAERMLGLDQMMKLVSKLPALSGPKDLHEAVDELRKELDALAAKLPKLNIEHKNYKKEAEYWRERAEEAEEELRLVKQELKWFKAKIKVVAASEASPRKRGRPRKVLIG